MWYFINVMHWKKKGFERTFILNPEFSREEIKRKMEAERIDSNLIQEMEENGIYQDHEIRFVVEKKLELSWDFFYENGEKKGYRIQRFPKKDTVTFLPDGSYKCKYLYTLLDRLEMWLEDTKENLKKHCKIQAK